MALCAWAVICRKSVVDRNDNLLSMFEVMENINFAEVVPEQTYKEKPVVIGGGAPEVAHVVSMWWRAEKEVPETIEARFSIQSPGRKIIYNKEFAVSLEAHERSRHMLRLPGFFFQGPGRYLYRIEVLRKTKARSKWDLVADVPLNIGMNERVAPVA